MSLRNALRANAAFSGLSGIALVFASGPIASWIGLDASWVLVAVGLGLVGYAVQLLVTARKEPIDPLEVRVAIGADLAWVVGSVVVLEWGPLTPAGEALVVAVAAVVLGFALLQVLGLRRSGDRAGPLRNAALAVGLLAAAAAPASARDEVPSPMPPIDELRVLPTSSEPGIDRPLDAVERAYAAKDVDAFVSLFSDDFQQVDVNRRVRIRGREAWRERTIRVNGAHPGPPPDPRRSDRASGPLRGLPHVVGAARRRRRAVTFRLDPA